LELIERAVHVTRIAIERKRAEEEIRQLNVGLERRVEERTAELLAANASLVDFKHALDEHAIVAITDPDGTITYANDRFCEISKYSREELLGQTHRIVNSGYHPEAFFRELWETISSGRTWKGEIRNRAKDGSIYWVNSTIVPFLGPDGKPQQYIAIRTDISVRKRMEEALHESEERVRLAAEAADIAVWEWDLKTNELKWDARMFEIYGLPPNPDGRAIYQDWTSAVLPEELAEHETRLQHTIATCGRDQREFRITRASDHAVRIIQASEMVIPGADGKAERMVGINFDSTESKLAEERIRELNAVLESRAAALEAANKELEAFSYSVSHDLRAPLRAVDGFSRMVLADYAPKLDDEGRRMLGVIRSEAQRMGRLIDDLLAFSRLGRQTIESARIDMHALAQEVFDELSALEPERQVRFELHPLPLAQGTEAMIRQVWINLLTNALKFTKEREVAEIEIGVKEAESGGRIYYVKDNGVGFDMRYVDKLFGVFQRLHNQQQFPGTGVGLALVQHIVQRHGGRVWAEAEVNHGATFYFTLPNQKS
jgi:PAS domain S-box-containing protein